MSTVFFECFIDFLSDLAKLMLLLLVFLVICASCANCHVCKSTPYGDLLGPPASFVCCDLLCFVEYCFVFRVLF